MAVHFPMPSYQQVSQSETGMHSISARLLSGINNCSVQHYLTMLGSTVLIPFLIVPPMGGAFLPIPHLRARA